jgi:hypothetical protein
MRLAHHSGAFKITTDERRRRPDSGWWQIMALAGAQQVGDLGRRWRLVSVRGRAAPRLAEPVAAAKKRALRLIKLLLPAHKFLATAGGSSGGSAHGRREGTARDLDGRRSSRQLLGRVSRNEGANITRLGATVCSSSRPAGRGELGGGGALLGRRAKSASHRLAMNEMLRDCSFPIEYSRGRSR